MPNAILAVTPGVDHRPAGPVIGRTSTGAHELQPLRPACAAHEGGRRCPHPATVVIGLRGFAQERDDERRGAQFCSVHGFDRLDALDPMRFAGGGK